MPPGTPTTTSGPSSVSASSSPTCTSAVPDKYGHVPNGSCDSYYSFYPNFAGNLAFAVLFGLALLVHTVEAIMFKKKFCWVVIMGAAWETAAFAIRALGAHDQQEEQYAIWGQLLFLLAPLWVNAFAYMTVARMVHFALPDKAMWGIKAVRLTLIFVWLDVVCFLVQVGGGSMLSADDGKVIRIGQKVYMAGIGLQMVFIIIFGAMTVAFWWKLRPVPGVKARRVSYLAWAMLALLVLILIRIIFRLVEFGPGVDDSNHLLTSEYYPFFLDAFPMVLSLFLLAAVHPGMVLRGPDSEFPHISRAEKKARKQQKKADREQRKASARNGGKSGFDQNIALVQYEALNSRSAESDELRRAMV